VTFGLAHVLSSPIGFIVPLAALGAILCLLYEWTRSLYPCIALHALNNSVAFGVADGRVWLTDAVDPRAKTSWRTGTGRYRNLGAAAPAGTEVAEPSLEDAYLLLRASVEGSEVAA